MPSNTSNTEQSVELPSSTVRTTVSLLVFIHLFCVLAGMMAIFEPSALQANLVRVLSPYTQVACLDLSGRPLYLAPRVPHDFPHEVATVTSEGERQVMADYQGLTPAARRRRHLARVFALYTDPQQQTPAAFRAALARAVGLYRINHSEATRSDVICSRQAFQFGDLNLQPQDLYTALVYRASDGELVVTEQVEKRHAATVDADGPAQSPRTDDPQGQDEVKPQPSTGSIPFRK